MVRVKYRYVVVRLDSPDPSSKFKDSAIAKTILKNVEKYYGDLGIASLETGFAIKYYNPQTKIAVIQNRHKPHRYMSSILPLITVIGSYQAKFVTLYTGATIVQCYKFIVRYHKQRLRPDVAKPKDTSSKK
uniref:Ribonuclease P/MRP protein subunit POP5 n=1 Tax=Tabanus bromius TaxID=304241 RepID=A0A0K8TL83_TABBR